MYIVQYQVTHHFLRDFFRKHLPHLTTSSSLPLPLNSILSWLIQEGLCHQSLVTQQQCEMTTTLPSVCSVLAPGAMLGNLTFIISFVGLDLFTSLLSFNLPSIEPVHFSELTPTEWSPVTRIRPLGRRWTEHHQEQGGTGPSPEHNRKWGKDAVKEGHWPGDLIARESWAIILLCS